jgi:hypothetical protein
MKCHQTSAVIAIGLLAATLFAPAASAQTARPPVARNVVLVHGAWADGSSWGEVIPRPQAAGLRVTAVQNPLTSLADRSPRPVQAKLQDGPTGLLLIPAHCHQRGGRNPGSPPRVMRAARAPDG